MCRVHKITEYWYINVYKGFINTAVCTYLDDSNDQSYLINNQTQFVAWALGPRATEEGLRDLAFFHTEYPRDGGSPSCLNN